MLDIAQWFGQDLTVASDGDLLAVGEPYRSEQRIVRRLLTNPGDYWFHPDYGAGLGQKIGLPSPALEIQAIVAAQIALEASVAPIPVPIIRVQNFQTGVFAVTINYFNNTIGAPRELSFSISQ